jgi:O-methyltransferase involved in polyketide biosynthesis
MDIDTTKPNAGRIYDYWLGGHHNFEADRKTAEQVLKLMPSATNAARLNRWFMYDAIQRLAQDGFDCYLDMATGLPTQGYIHELVPDARVLYNDIDPVTVQYGREIVGDNPNVRYIQANIVDIDVVLRAAEQHFGDQRRVAICFVGVTYFIADDSLRRILDRLHAWCATGSRMALSWLVADPAAFAKTEVAQIYQQMKSNIYPRDLETIRSMLSAWRIDAPGLIPLNEWSSVENWRPDDTVDEVAFDAYSVMVSKA